MRVVETIHPNTQCRTFTCDTKFTEGFGFPVWASDKVKPSDSQQRLFERISEIELTEEPRIRHYEIIIKIVEAFENSEKDWNHITESVIMAIAEFFGIYPSEIEISQKDERQKYDQGEREYISIYGLYEKLQKIAIPHDFKTHRQDWRNALVIAKGLQDEFDKANGAESTGFWKHQIKTFDAAFDALEALKLPEK